VTQAAAFNHELGLKINKVVHQVGVIDNLSGLRQVGVIPPQPAASRAEP
jgi:hypothetical protein